MPYKSVYRPESALNATLRALNATVNIAYQLGIPYGTYAYLGWQAIGLGKVYDFVD